MKRNESFQDGAYPDQLLATRLKTALPSGASRVTRIVIHNCSLQLSCIWPQKTVEAEYRDPSLKVVTVRHRPQHHRLRLVTSTFTTCRRRRPSRWRHLARHADECKSFGLDWLGHRFFLVVSWEGYGLRRRLPS